METSTNVKNLKKTNQASKTHSEETSEGVVNQQSSSRRTSVQNNQKFLIECFEISLFERRCIEVPYLTSELFYNNFQSILVFRSISKTLCDFTSFQKFLSKNAYIDFAHEEFFLLENPLVKEKFDFAKNEQIELHITNYINSKKEKAHFMDQLIWDTLTSDDSLIPEIENLKKKVILTIDDLYELRGFQELSDSNLKQAIDDGYIHGLNFTIDCKHNIKELNSNFNSNSLFKQKTIFFNALTRLSFGHVTCCLKLPSLQNLSNLFISWLGKGASIYFPVSLDNLSTLTIDRIDENVTIQFPKSFKNLKTCTIAGKWGVRPIGSNLTFNNQSFKYLRGLHLGNLDKKVIIELGNLKSLENLTLRGLNQGAKINLKTSLLNLNYLSVIQITDFPLTFCPNLRVLEINEISQNIIDFEDLNSLTTLRLNWIHKNLTIKALKNLQMLTIGKISPKVKIIFPKILENLTDLTIDLLCKSAAIEYPTALPKLKSVSIKNIHDEYYTEKKEPTVTYSLPESFQNIETLKITGYIDCHLHLPSVLDSLTTLEIATISEDNELILPRSLPKLTQVIINGQKASLNLPTSPNKTKSFSIETEDPDILKLLKLINERLI